MHCPFCQHTETRVIDSRISDDGDLIRRRRSCEGCGERFTTIEQANLKLPQIVKRNGNREPYNEQKILRGLERAVEKRPVNSKDIENVMHRIKRHLLTSGEREIPAADLGELMMDELRKLDQVAYVRFASVYRSFQDVDAFNEEIKRLQAETMHGRNKNKKN
ncbi:MAG: transcriptional regulator NrdR [Arenicella sp.]